MPLAGRAWQYPVDAHVHFHGMGRVGPTLNSAAENFYGACPGPGSFLGTLLLAQSSREDVFEQLAGGCQLGDWALSDVPGERQTIMASSEKGSIAVVCGRQVRCKLGLEVIAIGTTASYADGEELNVTLERVTGDGAIAVVPWGFGKWIGDAGRQMREFFRGRVASSVFAGDNGGRLQLLGLPKLLSVAKESGFRVLPGTDPFPFGGDYRRVGAFGFLAELEPNPSAPWATLREWLRECRTSPTAYGRGLNPLRFVYNQVRIQVHNRVLNRPGR